MAAASSSLRNLGRVLRNRALNTVNCGPVLDRLAGRGRSRSEVAKSIRTIFEALETRQMLSVLPAPQVSDWTNLTGASTTNNPTYNTTPSIAYDPADPNRMVMVYQVNLTNANSRPNVDQLVYVQGKYTVDGGKTWLTFDARPDGTSNAGNTIPLNTEDIEASIAARRTVLYTQATYPTVSFDRQHNFYVSYTEHRADNSHGVIVLQSFNLSATDGPQITSQLATLGGQSLAANPIILGTGKVLHQWFDGIDEAYWPTVAADSNLSTADIGALPGPLPAELLNQADPHSNDVYVAWTTDTTAPTSPFAVNNFNPNSILLTSSHDGGASFSTPMFVNVASGSTGYVGSDRDVAPKIVIAQGTVDGTTVKPGTVTVVWDDINSGRSQNPPVDILKANNVPGGINTYTQYDPTQYDLLDAATLTFVGGGFTAGAFKTFDVGTTPVATLAGNFDTDTRPDLVSLDAGSGTVTVRQNNGGNNFLSPVTITGLNNPVAMDTGDFDGDGKTDLIVVDDDGVKILTGTRDPASYFNAPVLVLATVPGQPITAVAVGNFDEDKAGLPDFAVTAKSGVPGVDGTITVGVNQGGLTFNASTFTSAGEDPTSIAVGDMDGDKHLDLVAANGASDNVAVIMGAGDGTFNAAGAYLRAVGGTPRQVGLADVDGDKLLDVVVLDDNGIDVALNTTVAVFSLAGTTTVIQQISNPTITQHFARFALGDLNADNKADILITDDANDGLVLGRGTGTTLALQYAPGQEILVGDPTKAPTPAVPGGVAFAGDLNGDSKMDVVVALQGQDALTTLLQVTTATTFALTTDIVLSVPATSLTSRGTTVTDFDVNVAFTHQDVGQLSVRLQPPPSALAKIRALPGMSSFQYWVLMLNHVADPGLTFNNQGATGADMGYIKDGTAKFRVGTVFDDDSPRYVADGSAGGGYTSSFAPERGRFTFDQLIALAGLTAGDFEGDWHLLVTDHVFNSPLTQRQYLDGWGISFTTDATAQTPVQVATTTVLGSLSGSNALKPGVANTIGIGPGFSVAIDNTLGAYSPNQGRVYVAFTNRSTATGNPADNTDIQMVSAIGGRGFGAAVLVNDDDALTDGYSEAVRSGNLTTRGRAQFNPAVTVDQYTGTVAVTYSDARQDAARVRFATSLQTSIDGGRTFSKSAFLNQPNVVVDATTGKSVTVGPIPDNGTFNDDPLFGMGYRQDVVAVGGHVYAVWSGNLNGGTANVNRLPDILTADVEIAAGPRVVSSTMGPVSQPGDLLNEPLADGTPILRSFVLTFDRDVDINTIITHGAGQNIFLYYRKPGVSGNVGDADPLDPNAAELLDLDPLVVPFNADTGVDIDPAKLGGPDHVMVRSVRISLSNPEVYGVRTGTYSYYVEPTIADRIRKPTTLTNGAYLTRDYTSDPANSNLVVPNAGTGGSGTPADDTTTSTINIAGVPTASNVEVITGIQVAVNLLHTNVSNLTLTLVAPDGITSYILGQAPAAGGRNMIRSIFRNDGLNDFSAANAPYTTAIDAATGRPAIVWDTATHTVAGTNSFFAVDDLNDLVAKLNDPLSGVSRNGAWKLVVSDDQGSDTGTLLNWTLSFDTAITSGQLGNSMDQNADATPGATAWSGTTIGDDYAAPNPTSDAAWDAASHTFHTPYQSDSLPIIVSGATTTNTHTYESPAAENDKSIFDPTSPAAPLPYTESSIAIGGDVNAKITDLTVKVNLTHGSADTLKLELIAPDGTVILLHRPEIIYRTPGTPGVRAPIADMGGDGPHDGLIFDDSATFSIGSILSATTTNASGTPFSGRFQPEDAKNVGRGLSLLDGKALAGTWKLRVTDTQPDAIGDSIAVPTGVAKLDNWSITATTETVVVNPPQTDPTTTPSVNSVVVTFDHDIDTNDMTVPSALAGTYTPVNRLVGPLGEIATNPTYAAAGTQLGVAIPDDGTPATSKITIADTYKIGHVRVKLDIAHANDPDLVITLIAPDGTPVTLVNQRGAADTANFTGTLFDDFAPTNISAGSAPFSNALGYKPESSLDAALRNKSAKGDWTLQVTDSAGNTKTGVINSWSLTFTPNVVEVTAGDPAYDPANTVPNRTFRIYFPDQRVSGSYSLTLNPQLRTQVTGFMLDSNRNAGLDALRDAVVAANTSSTTPTVPVIFNQTAAKTILAKDPAVPGSETTKSTLLITDSFDIRNLTLRLNATFTNDSKLTISLTSPDGVTVTLFDQFGNFGTRQNFTNTLFDDAATTPVQSGGAPYVGSFSPQQALSAFKGHNVYGEWTLTVVNASTTDTGSINNWSITAQKQVANTGLGEAGADQATVNFRLFNMAGGNNSSSTQWTPVSSTGSSAVGFTGTLVQNGNDLTVNTLTAGSITDIAVDPSDPSGNTVYVATASGGIWKTTNFLTSNPGGPTYVPLTDFGPVNGLNVGSLAVFANTSPTPQNVKLTGDIALGSTSGAYFAGFEAAKAFDGSFSTFFWGPNADYDYVGYKFGAPTLVTQAKFAPANSFGSLMVGGKLQGSTDGTTWTDLYTITSKPLDGTLTTATLDNPGYYTYVRYLGPAGINAHAMISELEFYGPAANTVSAGSGNRTVVIAGTGQGSAGYTETSANATNKVLQSPGVGFLLSTDGGSTWNLLDSLTNVDAAGNWLPISSPQRDHRFLNNATFKVVVDPRATPSGETIIYAAMTGPNGGLYRSVDTGKHWTLMRAGDATDVILDLNSGTVNALTNPTGNVQTIYAGFRGEGVFVSPNRGSTWNQLMGNAGGTPLVRDGSVAGLPAITTLNPADPNGNKGRVVLAMPSPTGNASADTLHQGWLYAAVVNADAQNYNGTLDGLYMTKDFGQNWTEIPLAKIAGTTFAPTNDSGTGATYNIVDGTGRPGGLGNYDLTLAVDPANPAVLYVGGAGHAAGWSTIRVDTTRVYDAHAFYTPLDAADGGQLNRNVTATVTTKDLTTISGNNPWGSGTTSIYDQNTITTQPGSMYVNLVTDPNNPFVNNATYYVRNTTSWQNTGADAFWHPIDSLFTLPGYHPNTQRLITTVDPLTGQTRLIVATDSGLFTAVANADGSLNAGVGTAELANGSRNGNLQNAQVLSGAAQPDSLAADLAGALFLAMTNTNGLVVSNPGVLANGNVTGSVSFETGTGGGVVADQTGSGNSYAHFIPGILGTDFFQFFPPGTVNNNFDNIFVGQNVGGIGRTFGLINSTAGTGPFGDTQDTQWPDTARLPIAANPVNGNQLLIGSYTGTVYASYNQGQFWQRIAAAADLDGTIISTLAFGAPDTSSDSLSNLVFVGTSGVIGNTGTNNTPPPAGTRGQVFVSFSGGGSGAGNAWVNLDSAGLDGSAIKAIVTNPNRGSHEVYVVTEKGVYHMDDASVPGATWTNITNNLFAIGHNSFGNADLAEPMAQSLSSVAADWRYQLPNASGTGTHPILYASGSAGVFRSVDNGATWTAFPNQALDGAAADGGYLPTVKVTDLDLALGRINPTTGMPEVNANSPSVLLASTYGRGQFAIRVAPLVFNGAFGQDTPLGERTITGLSQLKAFGNSMRFNVYDVSDPSNPVVIATDLQDTSGANDGTFSVTLPGGLTATKVAFQAVDGAGVAGPLTTLLVPPSTPSAPDLAAASDSGTSNSDDLTNVRKPTINDGGNLLPAGNTVTVYVNGTVVGTQVVDGGGHWSFTLPNTLADGTYAVTVSQTDPQNQSSAQSAALTLVIDGTGPSGAANTIPGSTANVAIAPFTVATFTDAHKVLSATINWGDGTAPVTITNGSPANGGTFNVVAGHTYTSAGSYTVSVTATDDAGNTTTVTKPASIAAPAYAFGLTGQAFNPTEGSVFNGRVAIVNDGNLSHTAGNLTATINWGDGTTSAGTIVAGSTAGSFNVLGTHTYLDDRQDQTAYDVTVTVTTTDGKSGSIGSIADVSNAIPTGTVSTPAAIYLGQSVTLNLTANDASPADVAAGFDYVIDWGDGTQDVVTRTPGNGAGIARSHTFNSVSTAITVTISDKDASRRAGTRVITTPITVKTAPALSATAVNGDANRSDISQITFNVSNTDIVGGLSLSNLKLFYNGDGVHPVSLAGAVLTFDPASGNGTLDLSNLTTPLRDGDYQLQITVAGTLLPPISFFKLQGDINGDGKVEAKDLAIINRFLGKAVGQPGVNAAADLNHDGFINAADVNLYNKLKNHKATGGAATLTLQTGKVGKVPTLDFGKVTVNTNGGYIDLVIKNANANLTELKIGKITMAGAAFSFAFPGQAWGPTSANTTLALPANKAVAIRVYLKPSAKVQNLAGKLKFSFATKSSGDYKDVTVPVKASIVAATAAAKAKGVKHKAVKHQAVTHKAATHKPLKKHH